MRTFEDNDGVEWVAAVEREEGPDYKGRYVLVFRSGSSAGDHLLRDVRWNSERTAERTLDTMSLLELRRRVRWATGRDSAPVQP